MTSHVFVLGLTATQRAELAVLSQTDDVEFHGLLDVERLLDTPRCDLDELLEQALDEIESRGIEPDGFIAHWDFPTSVLAPMLAAHHGLPGPSLEAVLRCEHKLWSRTAQRESVPECTPGFAVFDPDDPDALTALDGLRFPVFVKPVKSYSSQLTARIDDAEAFERFRRRLAQTGNRLGGAFQQALDRVQLPPEIAEVPAGAALAEEVVTGHQYAPEGSVHGGQVRFHGTFDMLMHPTSNRLQRLVLPTSAPTEVQERMHDVAERYLAHVGFDDGCFNVEFRWDPETDALRLIEINTRMSQSHSDLFAKVDGLSNHAVALDVATGSPPRAPQGQGAFAVAEQLHVSTDRGGTVRSVPGRDEVLAIRERYPDTLVEVLVREGQTLGEGVFEDGGIHDLAIVYHGAADRRTLDRQHDDLVARLLAATAITSSTAPTAAAG